MLVYSLKGIEVVLGPHFTPVVLMEALHVAVALRVIEGREDQLRAYQQRQLGHTTQDIGVGMPSAEAALVVDLRVGRNADVLPRLDQEVRRFLRAALRILHPGRVPGNDVDGIEARHGLSARQEPRIDIDLHERVGLLRPEMRVGVSRRFLGFPGMGHPRSMQFAFNAAETRQGSGPPFQTFAYGAGSDETKVLWLARFLFQFAAHTPNRLTHFLR
jgi:hypothetical protein